MFNFYFRKTNRSVESARMLERCLSLEPAFTLAYLELIRLRGRQDRKVGVLLRRVIKLNPKHPHHITSYAEWLKERGNNTIIHLFNN